MQNLLLTKKWFLSKSFTSLLLKSFLGSLLLIIATKIEIPMKPVPITGQTLAVTVLGLGLGLRAGTGAVLFYLIEGIAGLPVFAGGGSGWPVGPSAGYLYGFVPSVMLLGYYSDRGVLASWPRTILVTMAATAITFACGLWHLSHFVPADELLAAGFYPFIPGGIIKGLLACALVIPTQRFFSKI
mgnify:CR=1 FL=1